MKAGGKLSPGTALTPEIMDREDLLELTRRMNRQRHCFTRIAGAYMSAGGIISGTFNTNFRKLSPGEQDEKIAIAREIPFAGTNTELKQYRFPDASMGVGTLWQMLFALTQCELKNDALLDMFYELAGERYVSSEDYCILFFSGAYDRIPRGADGLRSGDSEVTCRFLIGAFCPLYGEYEPGLPDCGFLFPAITDGTADLNRIRVFRCEDSHPELLPLLGL